MKNSTNYKKFMRYTSLSILGTLGVSCYILVDTFFVSKGLGTKGLAALNIAIPIYNFIHGSGLMLGMGGATKFSIYKSGHDIEAGNRIFTNTIYIGLIISAFFVFIGLFFSQPLASFLGADFSVLKMTNTYLKWLLLFAPVYILNDILLCFVRNDNNPSLSTFAMLIGSFANIILDYIFIFPLHMGIFGAIFATGISSVISIFIMYSHWLTKRAGFKCIKTKLYAEVTKQVLSLGFPSLIAQVASGISIIVFNILILKLEGNTGVAAYSITANISLVVCAVYTGISQGIQPLISESYGKNERNNIQVVCRYGMITMLVLSFIIYLIIFVFAVPITGLFNSEKNMQLQALSTIGLKLYFTAIAFVGFNTIIAVFFTSTENAVPAHILSLLRGVILIVPLAFLLSNLWDMTGIWLTYPITEGIVALFGYVTFRYNKRKMLN